MGGGKGGNGELLGRGFRDRRRYDICYSAHSPLVRTLILLQKTSKEAERCSLAVCLGEKGDEFGEQLLPWEVS